MGLWSPTTALPWGHWEPKGGLQIPCFLCGITKTYKYVSDSYFRNLLSTYMQLLIIDNFFNGKQTLLVKYNPIQPLIRDYFYRWDSKDLRYFFLIHLYQCKYKNQTLPGMILRRQYHTYNYPLPFSKHVLSFLSFMMPVIKYRFMGYITHLRLVQQREREKALAKICCGCRKFWREIVSAFSVKHASDQHCRMIFILFFLNFW